MKRFFVPAFVALLAFGCHSAEEKTVNDSLVDSLPVKADSSAVKNSVKLTAPHLSDTAKFSGNWVIFLRPDDARFAFYEEQRASLTEADADFGVAISTAIDSIIDHKDFKGIKGMVSTKRYITLLDCKGGPVTIDRDTMNYGTVLSAKNKEVKTDHNIYGGQYYLDMIRNYFGR